ARVRRTEVEQSLEPGQLLLDRGRDRLGDVLRGRPGVDGLHLHRGRREGWVPVHRERTEGERPEQHDRDRDDSREDRPPDEEIADLGRGAHGPTLILGGADGAAITALSPAAAALVSAAGRYATAVARCPGATFWTPSTTTPSPALRPCTTSHAPPSHDVASPSRAATMLPSPITYTNATPRARLPPLPVTSIPAGS